MARYWVMRSDRDSAAFFWRELQAGRLRQGWGYLLNQDLRAIAMMLRNGEVLSNEQLECWRGNRRMLESEQDSIRPGDIVISPHLPQYGMWSLSRVTGPYSFEIPTDMGDFGHVLPVTLVSNRPVNPQEECVSARLRETMRNPSRLWNIDHLGPDVEAIIRALERGVPDRSLQPKEKILSVVRSVEDAGWSALSRSFQGTEFERPCIALLERIFGEGNVEHTAGASERGADAICTYLDPLGGRHRIAVQIKMWTGDASSLRPFDQIREACGHYQGITSGVILSTSERGSKEFEDARKTLEEELRIPVRVLYRRDLLRLFMTHLPRLAELEPEE